MARIDDGKSLKNRKLFYRILQTKELWKLCDGSSLSRASVANVYKMMIAIDGKWHVSGGGDGSA
jgi:hypothetical protein